jgi:hypothetical protein
MRKRATVLLCWCLATLAAILCESSSQDRRFFVNRIAVRQVEMGFRLGGAPLRVRLLLASGEAIEQELSEGTDVEYFLSLTRILGSGGGRMFAEVRDGELVGVQMSVP